MLSTRSTLMQMALAVVLLSPGLTLIADANHLNHATFTAHSPIVITSNADWYAGMAITGVRSGTGTEADPFIISGWIFDVPAGNAIRVTGTTLAFTIRDNLIISGPTATGVSFKDSTARGRIISNDFYHRGIGIDVARADATISANVFQDTVSGSVSSRSVVLTQTASTVTGNTMSGVGTAVEASYAEPLIQANDIINARTGVSLKNVHATTVAANRFTAVTTVGITSTTMTDLVVAANVFEGGAAGLILKSGEALVDGNTFDTVSGVAIRADTVDLTATWNSVIGSSANAIEVVGGQILLTDNSVTNAIGTAIRLEKTTGTVARSTLDRNGGGIALVTGSIVTLTSNQLTNNVWGYSIPYTSRQAIPLMGDNWANGVNVDGAVIPTDRIYHWREANLDYNGVTRDAGFGAGYYGAPAREGGIVFYEVTGATVRNSYFAYHLVGVYAENSFNVVVNDSRFVNNGCGIVFRNVLGFAKENNISLDVDPPGYCGIDVYGGWVGLYNNDIYFVEIGIRMDAVAQGEIIGNVIVRTSVGLHLTGTFEQDRDAVLVKLNIIKEGKTGVILVRWQSTFIENTVYWNTRVGVRLEQGGGALIAQNNITFNLQGVSAIGNCGTFSTWLCASPDLRGNFIAWNVQTGVRLNTTAHMESNTVIRNGGVGVLVTDGGGEFRFNNVSLNARTGMVVNGRLAAFLGNNVSANLGDGIRFSGTLATFRRDTFSWNLDTGMFLQGGLYVALELKVNANLNGIIVNDSFMAPTLPALPVLPTVNVPTIGTPFAPNNQGDDPLWIHLSEIAFNRENAIRAPIFVDVNATYNWWGSEQAPATDTEVTGNFGNTVTPGTRFVPWFRDRAMMTTGPIAGL